MEALAKQKDFELVGEWKRSLINHLYWCVVSTPIDERELIKAEWLSLDNHIHNQHSDHGGLYPKCSHEELQGQDRQKKWFRRRKLSQLVLPQVTYFQISKQALSFPLC